VVRLGTAGCGVVGTLARRGKLRLSLVGWAKAGLGEAMRGKAGTAEPGLGTPWCGAASRDGVSRGSIR